MTFSTSRLRLPTLLFCTFFFLGICGCASSVHNDQAPVSEEEAYIDLKQGFSLVVPSAWVRQRIPVSSPKHHPNSVEWLMAGKNGSNIFKVKTISLQDPVPPEEQLATRREERCNLVEDTPQSILHPAGPASRWQCQDEIGNIILLTVEGPEDLYIISARIAAANSPQLLPMIEKVIASFAILQY